jgi:membrane protein DedA with SNARE-associated domain
MVEKRLIPMDFVVNHGVPLVALLVFVTELGVPTGIPFEVALLLAGATAVHSLQGLVVAVAIVALADLAGTTTLFLVGRSGGRSLGTRILCRLGAMDAIERWRGRVGASARKDIAIVIGGRLLPLARMPFTMAVGLLRLPTRHFLVGATPGAILWAGVPLVLGYVLRHRVHTVTDPIERVNHLGIFAVPVLLAVAVALLIVRGLRRPQASAAGPCGTIQGYPLTKPNEG